MTLSPSTLSPSTLSPSPLSQGELKALRNLSRKKAGDEVGWIGIAEARGLTELGLAARNQSGWRITAEGEAALEQQGGALKVERAVATIPFPIRALEPRAPH